MTTQSGLPRVTPFTKFALATQVFLLRHNWMGAAGNIIMVITTTGRKSGRSYTTPIGYQRDGDSVIAFNVGGRSNWYKNVLQNPAATLMIKGQTMQVRGRLITDKAEIAQVVDLYLKEQANIVERFWKLTASASAEERMKLTEHIKFIRFQPVN